MSDTTFLLEVVTPEKVLFSGQVDSVEIPGKKGEFQILAGHTPFLTSLTIGSVSILSGAKTDRISISGGYCEVMQHKTTILATTAESAREIDTERAEEARKRAEQRIQEANRLRKAADAVAGAEAVVAAKCNQQGHLFGSVSPAEIAANLREQGFEVADEGTITNVITNVIGTISSLYIFYGRYKAKGISAFGIKKKDNQ